MDHQEHPLVTSTRERLGGYKGSWPEIAVAGGVSYSWLQKFACGRIKNPTIDSLQGVINALNSASREKAAA